MRFGHILDRMLMDIVVIENVSVATESVFNIVFKLGDVAETFRLQTYGGCLYTPYTCIVKPHNNTNYQTMSITVTPAKCSPLVRHSVIWYFYKW